MNMEMPKRYRLLDADGSIFESEQPGELGGQRRLRIYGRLDCRSARKFIAQAGYVENRVFFANEQSAIAAGYRPCGHCLREQYQIWKRGGLRGTPEYPWFVTPKLA